jgi:opacity protein-like surface antigen
MPQRITFSGLIVAVAAATAATASATASAQAADLDYTFGDAPPPVAETKVEFGSGWYVRGDIGAVRLPSMQVSSPSNLPTATNFVSPSAPPTHLGGGSDVGYDASLAGGYAFNKWFRTELMADFHQPMSATGNSGNGNVFCPTGVDLAGDYANGGCTGNYRASIRSYDVLVNGYVDLGTWYHVTPYVGAGVGMSFGHYQTSATYVQANGIPYQVTFTDPRFNASYYFDYDKQASGTYYNFAWALMAGFAIDVYDHTKLDIGYRYLNLGSIPGVSGTLSYNEVRAGLRYMIDN